MTTKQSIPVFVLLLSIRLALTCAIIQTIKTLFSPVIQLVLCFVWKDSEVLKLYLWVPTLSSGHLSIWTLTLHPVFLHILDLCDALSEVRGEAGSVLLAWGRENDQYLTLSPRIG